MSRLSLLYGSFFFFALLANLNCLHGVLLRVKNKTEHGLSQPLLLNGQTLQHWAVTIAMRIGASLLCSFVLT